MESLERPTVWLQSLVVFRLRNALSQWICLLSRGEES